MNTVNEVGYWVEALAFFIGLPFLFRWAYRSERRRFNLQYGRSLTKKEIRRARRQEAREERPGFWRKTGMTLLPVAWLGRLRRAEQNLDDESLVDEVVQGFGFGVICAGLCGVFGSLDWMHSDGVGNPFAWALLLWGVSGLLLTRRWWRLIKAFRAEHGGRMPGEDPESESARRSIWAWERQRAFKEEMERTGLKAKYVRKLWREQGLM